jgi:hypothetical protein
MGRLAGAYRHDVALFFKWFAVIKVWEAKPAELTTADVRNYRQHSANSYRLLSGPALVLALRVKR